MKIFQKSLLSLLVLSTFMSAGTFEQDGVKEGNTKVSIGVYNTFPSEGDASTSIYGGVGHFITNDLEVSLDTFVTASNGEMFYYLKPGVNYYFMKTPTLTPYAGTNIYYFDSTADNSVSSYGNNYHVGAHQFLTENAAVTVEAGMDFFEATEYLQSYTNVYLTYFFN